MATTGEVRVYSAEYCDKNFAKKSDVPADLPKGIPNIIVLGKNDPVPAGTPAGTVIIREGK